MLRDAWSKELTAARGARERHELPEEWRLLQRAHVLSQPMAGPHLKTHVAMLGSAVRRRDGREFAGQLFRLVVAAPGSWSGRYPVGNTGGSDVSAFLEMPIPADLAALLEDTDAPHRRV
jgi:hypothetical protein